MKVLNASQKRAEWESEVAHVKSRKMKEISHLKQLELAQREVLAVQRSSRDDELDHILNRANAIGKYENPHLPVDSVYDNTISAMKARLEKKRNSDNILKEKEKQLRENFEKRNKVVAMERDIEYHVKMERRKALDKILLSKVQAKQSMQDRVNQAYEELMLLENQEKRMMQKLSNTKLSENLHLRNSVASLHDIQSRSFKSSHKERGRNSLKSNPSAVFNPANPY